MAWRCARVRRQLALLAGDDLPDGERLSVEQHLIDCACCRGHLASLRASQGILSQIQAGGGVGEPPSLWPALRGALASGEQAARPRTWLPLGAMVAASIAIVVVMGNRSAGGRASFEVRTGGVRPFPAAFELQSGSLGSQTNPQGVTRGNERTRGWETFDAIDREPVQFYLESSRPFSRSGGF